MHILVTNDDGVQAPGLLALAAAMRRVGKVTVLAPDRNWSASGHVKTMHRPLRVRPDRLADGTEVLTCDGAPSDCVAVALLGLVKNVDLVVSGINPFANLGHDVTYSGTVTAAMEAVIHGLPGVAVSLDGERLQQDYAPAADVAVAIVQTLIRQGLSRDALLSINVPRLPAADIRGMRITRQGQRVYRDQLIERDDPRGRPYYWIGGERPTGVPEDGTDFGALADGYVSITPLQLDLTAYRMCQDMASWGLG